MKEIDDIAQGEGAAARRRWQGEGLDSAHLSPIASLIGLRLLRRPDRLPAPHLQDGEAAPSRPHALACRYIHRTCLQVATAQLEGMSLQTLLACRSASARDAKTA